MGGVLWHGEEREHFMYFWEKQPPDLKVWLKHLYRGAWERSFWKRGSNRLHLELKDRLIPKPRIQCRNKSIRDSVGDVIRNGGQYSQEILFFLKETSHLQRGLMLAFVFSGVEEDLGEVHYFFLFLLSPNIWCTAIRRESSPVGSLASCITL